MGTRSPTGSRRPTFLSGPGPISRAERLTHRIGARSGDEGLALMGRCQVGCARRPSINASAFHTFFIAAERFRSEVVGYPHPRPRRCPNHGGCLKPPPSVSWLPWSRTPAAAPCLGAHPRSFRLRSALPTCPSHRRQRTPAGSRLGRAALTAARGRGRVMFDEPSCTPPPPRNGTGGQSPDTCSQNPTRRAEPPPLSGHAGRGAGIAGCASWSCRANPDSHPNGRGSSRRRRHQQTRGPSDNSSRYNDAGQR